LYFAVEATPVLLSFDRVAHNPCSRTQSSSALGGIAKKDSVCGCRYVWMKPAAPKPLSEVGTLCGKAVARHKEILDSTLSKCTKVVRLKECLLISLRSTLQSADIVPPTSDGREIRPCRITHCRTEIPTAPARSQSAGPAEITFKM